MATGESLFLGNGECAGNHVDRRMSAAQAIALVHLERDTGRRVAERGPEAIRARCVPEQRRGRARGAGGGELGKARVLGKGAAAQHGAQRVEEHELGGGHGGRGERVETYTGGETGEPIEIVAHATLPHRTAPPIGAFGLVRDRYWPKPGFCSSTPSLPSTI